MLDFGHGCWKTNIWIYSMALQFHEQAVMTRKQKKPEWERGTW